MTKEKQDSTLAKSIQYEDPEARTAQSTANHDASMRILSR
jgi:hypothetical protein